MKGDIMKTEYCNNSLIGVSARQIDNYSDYDRISSDAFLMLFTEEDRKKMIKEKMSTYQSQKL